MEAGLPITMDHARTHRLARTTMIAVVAIMVFKLCDNATMWADWRVRWSIVLHPLLLAGFSTASTVACLWIDAACRLTNDHLRPGAVPTSWKAVRGFFIPGWNVLHSYRVFAALRRAADPLGLPASNEHEPVDAAGYRNPALQERASFHWRVPAPVGPWCAAYWTWLGATLVIGRLRATHDLSTMQWTSLVLFKSALMLVAGTLFLFVMRGIDRRQTERVRRLVAMTDASEGARPARDER